MNSPLDSASPHRALAERIQRIYLGGRTGRLEITAEGGRRQLYFHLGELFLPGSHPLAVLIKPHLKARAAARSSGAAAPAAPVSPGLVGLIERIAATITGWEAGEYHFYEGREELPQGLLGPLPTSLLVMDQAVEGFDEAALRARLGSQEGRFRAVRFDPQIAGVACLAPQELELLEELRTARRLGNLLQGEPRQRAGLVRDLCRLEAVGLVERLPGPATDSSAEDVTRAIVRRFASRVGERLLDDPLQLSPEEHRTRLAELLAHLGDLNHYELLDLPLDIPGEKIWDAYEAVARLVHPGHARRLSLEGREGIFEILFERATQAYLTLSDPRRRAEYDRECALAQSPGPGEEERLAERRELARRYYQQALEMMGSEDFHFAVELLRQATRQDPRPEYYTLLGQVLAKNEHPRWQRQAADSLRRALRQGSTDAAVPLLLARVCEGLGQRTEAERLYREILDRQPEDPLALKGLARLRDEPDERAGGGWWRRLLGG